MHFGENSNLDLQTYVEQMIAHQDNLKAFIYSIMPGSPDVDDVVQNTNAVLWQKRDRFKPKTNFTAWAFRIARIQVMHQLDRAKRDRRLVFSNELIEIIVEKNKDQNLYSQRLSALEKCVEKLTDSQRSLIRARYTPGQSLEKQAETTGRSPGSLRIALHRIRNLIKDCVEKTLTNDPA